MSRSFGHAAELVISTISLLKESPGLYDRRAGAARPASTPSYFDLKKSRGDA